MGSSLTGVCKELIGTFCTAAISKQSFCLQMEWGPQGVLNENLSAHAHTASSYIFFPMEPHLTCLPKRLIEVKQSPKKSPASSESCSIKTFA